MLSFNSPLGQCPACRGLGVEDRVDPELLVGDPGKTLREGALVLTTPSGYLVYSQITMDSLDLVCRTHGFTADIPWRELTEEQRQVVLYGSDRIRVPLGKHTLESRLRWAGITARPREEGLYGGIIPVIEGILRVKRNKNALRFARSLPCGQCRGTRLRPEALEVRFRGKNMAELAEFSVEGLAAFLACVSLEGSEAAVGEPLIQEVRRRCALLMRLGVGHLELARAVSTLAGGEARRVRLANQVRVGLKGLIHVLDEPTVGLHARDVDRLLSVLESLRDRGNTVLVVEHDLQVIRSADHVIELGPGAGEEGGRLLYSGGLAGLLSCAGSPTGGQLAADDFLSSAPALGGAATLAQGIHIRGAYAHNLRDLDLHLPRGGLTAITGVSGAGKSTLFNHVLLPSAALGRPVGCREIDGLDRFGRVLALNSRRGKGVAGNPATHCKVLGDIRALFAATDLARERGYTRAHFSRAAKGGRCELCKGAGHARVEMGFFSDVRVQCEACGGNGFSSEVLECRVAGLNMAGVMSLTADRAVRHFGPTSKVACKLEPLRRLGLGYLSLGQPTRTLSAGEWQRLKLSALLQGQGDGPGDLLVLDEPTTGLHPADVRRLIQVLRELIQLGHSILAVEHHPMAIAAADHVLELGPGAGEEGGRLVKQASK